MKLFTDLYTTLDATTKTNQKIAAMVDYFIQATPADAAWALFFLSGRKLKQPVPSKRIRQLAIAQAGVAEWLFSECYDAVGDLSETIVLLLPPAQNTSELSLQFWVEQKLMPLRTLNEQEQITILLEAWRTLDQAQRYIWNKLITGQFRVGVSQQMVIKALARFANIEVTTITHRLMGHWQPTAEFFAELVSIHTPVVTTLSRPYPFYLSYPLTDELTVLGDIKDWQIEWKWDGIRAQMIRREKQNYLWSRGEDLITDRFPELISISEGLPDGTVLDGEILVWKNNEARPFTELQLRIGRKTVSKKLLENTPVIFLIFDCLEYAGVDIRHHTLVQRRAQLQTILANLPSDAPLQLSPLVIAENWQQLQTIRQESRQRRVEGLMIKSLSGGYLTGRKRGGWWKWKIDPYTVDAVLIAAQKGHGRRANLYTDYTFAVWSDKQLIPFAKAYSGLTDEEIKGVDDFIRRNTLGRFGPVRTVKAKLVFEIAFEAIQPSSRHKSGVAVRFPRILRARLDKKIEQADSLLTLQELLAV